MARNKKHINDKFYTNEDKAKRLISFLALESFDTIIEPSAGSGSFSNNIKDIIALDIDPENDNIIKMNWFDYNNNNMGNTLVIGNPPFGNQGALAMKFIKKSIELGVNTIAFILPKSFKKESTKSKIPLNYHLEKEIDMDDDSFTLEGISYKVPCVFQIWVKKDYDREFIEMLSTTPLFNFVKKSDTVMLMKHSKLFYQKKNMNKNYNP